jgi:cold shock CspA family protein
MRFKGTLVEWKDDRGFGFIEPAEGGARIFCHLKAFEVRVRRPMPGDKLTYEVGKDAQGLLAAVKVRPVGLEDAQYQPNSGSRRNPKSAQRDSSGVSASVPQSLAARYKGVAICLIAVTAFAGWNYFQSKQAEQLTADDEKVERAALTPGNMPAEKEQTSAFQCDGRVYCSDMRSRAEAEFFVKHCPGTKMDGDHDGVPCENDSRF